MSLVFGEDACDRSKSPVLIRLVKFSCMDACIVQPLAERFKLRLVFDREMNVRRVVIHWSAIRIGVFNSGVAGLNSLLREWEVSARDGVHIVLWSFVGNLELSHNMLSKVWWSHFLLTARDLGRFYLYYKIAIKISPVCLYAKYSKGLA